MKSEKYTEKFNIMIIGDEKVGKSSILERYNIYKYKKNIIKDILTKSLVQIENKH
jgi:GTPase SAR1 family protein